MQIIIKANEKMNLQKKYLKGGCRDISAKIE